MAKNNKNKYAIYKIFTRIYIYNQKRDATIKVILEEGKHSQSKFYKAGLEVERSSATHTYRLNNFLCGILDFEAANSSSANKDFTAMWHTPINSRHKIN